MRLLIILTILFTSGCAFNRSKKKKLVFEVMSKCLTATIIYDSVDSIYPTTTECIYYVREK